MEDGIVDDVMEVCHPKRTSPPPDGYIIRW
jgi:hypothetical protein